jgi:hypothetical protein
LVLHQPLRNAHVQARSCFADTVAFRLAWKSIGRGAGALDEKQIAQLAMRFDLETDGLRKLSHTLAIDLSPLPGIGTNLIPASRSKAAVRGATEFNRLLERVDAAARELRIAIAEFDRLTPNAEAGGDYIDVFYVAFRSVLTSHDQLTIGLPVMRKVAKNPEAVLRIAPDDKRRLRDPRRTCVLEDIFRFWASTGRKLSYTTDTLNKRGGKLIAFVNAVIGCITDPPGGLSGDTIISEMNALRARTSDNP